MWGDLMRRVSEVAGKSKVGIMRASPHRDTYPSLHAM